MKRRTIIKRRPLISILGNEFSTSMPYDPIHLLLQCIVKKTITLIFGLHEKTGDYCIFVFQKKDIVEINCVLSFCGSGFPGGWVKHPIEIENMGKYKAETFKILSLYYAKYSSNAVSFVDYDQWTE